MNAAISLLVARSQAALCMQVVRALEDQLWYDISAQNATPIVTRGLVLPRQA